MLKKTITYENFNGETESDDFFFHLSKAELIELEMSKDGGLSQWLQNVVKANDGKTIIEEFKKIILSSYGQRSADGKRFVKNQALRDEFESTEAYSVLFVELVTNTDAAIEFVNGVIPQGMAAEAAKVVSLAPVPPIPPTPPAPPPPPPEPQTISKAEVEEMSKEDLIKLGSRISAGEVRVADN